MWNMDGNSLTIVRGHVGPVVGPVSFSHSLKCTVIITGNAAILKCLCDGLSLVGSQDCWKAEGANRPKVFCFSSHLYSPTTKPTRYSGNEFHRNLTGFLLFSIQRKGSTVFLLIWRAHKHTYTKWWVRKYSTTICFSLCFFSMQYMQAFFGGRGVGWLHNFLYYTHFWCCFS